MAAKKLKSNICKEKLKKISNILQNNVFLRSVFLQWVLIFVSNMNLGRILSN
jgi:hypothetical protein